MSKAPETAAKAKRPRMSNRRQNQIFNMVRTLLAVVISLGIVLAIIVLVSDEPGTALKAFLTGPTTSLRRMGNVVETAIPYMFTGLAACVMFNAKQFSLIGDGSFFIGALVATSFALNTSFARGLHPALALLLGMVCGAVCGILPGFLKAKWNTNEFVVSMMWNEILILFGLYILLNVIRDPNSGFVASHAVPESSKLSQFIPGTKIHTGLLVALVMVAAVTFLMYRTKWGFHIRMTGKNQQFARYAGCNTFLVILMVQVIGGALAGLGGATEVLGMYDRFQWQVSPGYGFDGMTVAILAGNNPALVPVGALFLAYLRVGSEIMARVSDVPNEAVFIVQGIVMLLVTATAFLARWRHMFVVQSAKGAQRDAQNAGGANA